MLQLAAGAEIVIAQRNQARLDVLGISLIRHLPLMPFIGQAETTTNGCKSQRAMRVLVDQIGDVPGMILEYHDSRNWSSIPISLC